MQNCIDAVSNALARSKVGCLTAVSSPLPFAHVQLTRGEFKDSAEPFAEAARVYGKGMVDTHNLRKMYLTHCKARQVREIISPRKPPAITPQSPRSHIRPCPPLQGKRPVSAPVQAGTMSRMPPKRVQESEDALQAVRTAARAAGRSSLTCRLTPHSPSSSPAVAAPPSQSSARALSRLKGQIQLLIAWNDSCMKQLHTEYWRNPTPLRQHHRRSQNR